MLQTRRLAAFRLEGSAVRAAAADMQAVQARNARQERVREDILRSLDRSLELKSRHNAVAQWRAETNEMASLRLRQRQSNDREQRFMEQIFALRSQLAAKRALPRVGPWMGAAVSDPRPAEDGSPTLTGAVIIEIVNHSPAHRANLEKGDRVLAVDGQAVAGAQDFKRVMAQKAGGQPVTLDIARQNALLRVTLQPCDSPQ